jgi:hypothetical protein
MRSVDSSDGTLGEVACSAFSVEEEGDFAAETTRACF